MNAQPSDFHLKAIGFVRNGVHEYSGRTWAEIVSEIVIRPELSEALDSLNEFSHIIILFWTHKTVPGSVPAKIHPKQDPDLPLVGLFATRSPNRPNPVCITTVKLLERRENILKVQGLDAFDGTPVIDIKPYIPGNDSISEARVPEWVKEVQKRSC